MKFGQLLYGKDEEVFIFYTTSQLQSASLMLIGRELKSNELKLLRDKAIVVIRNLITKIDSSGVGK
jgi:hypothetical protein